MKTKSAPLYQTDKFTYDQANNTLVAFASDLELAPGEVPPYIFVQSVATNMTYVFEHVGHVIGNRQEGEIHRWDYQACTKRLPIQPKCQTIHIWND